MGKYTYTDEEKDFNKVLKMNQNESFSLEKRCSSQINRLDESINSSEVLLRSLGYNLPNKTVSKKEKTLSAEIQEIKPYKDLVRKANVEIQNDIELEDLLSEKEFQDAYKRLDAIHEEFSHKTSIVNKTDLMFLDNMLCLLIFLQKRGFSLKLGKTNLTKALPKCKKETQHGNYNLCRNGCPQRQLFIMLL